MYAENPGMNRAIGRQILNKTRHCVTYPGHAIVPLNDPTTGWPLERRHFHPDTARDVGLDARAARDPKDAGKTGFFCSGKIHDPAPKKEP